MNSIDMKYEWLLRNAFSCGRLEDPYGLANADVVTHAKDGSNERLIEGITKALNKVTNDYKSEEPGLVNKLLELEESLGKDQSNANAYRIIEEATEVFAEYGIS